MISLGMEWSGDIEYGMRPVGLEWGHYQCVWNGNEMGTTGIETIRNGMGTLTMGLLRPEQR